jgi:Protein of unknown function (DUF3604)
MKKHNRNRFWWLVGVLAVVVGLVLAFASGCGTTPTTQVANQPNSAQSEAAAKAAFPVDDANANVPEPAAKVDWNRDYSPYANRKYPDHVYFGDTHHHTANSGDAFMGGDRLGPEDSYRFARGEQVTSSSGVPVRLSRPLDFLVVSDHAEGLGVMFEVYKGNPALVADPTVAKWAAALKAGGEQARAAANEVVSDQAQNKLPPVVKDPKIVGPIMKSVWQAYTATAEKYNEPGRFTAMIGFEWTSVPGGNNLHRNVLFRDNKDKADQIFPFSSWQSEDPEKLWEWMAKYEEKTGGKLLAIPHNGNLSNGRMFALTDFEGNPMTADYAKRRARWEPLHEAMQTKGSSETHPTLSPNDEFADFGIKGWEYGNLTLEGEPETPEMRQYMFIRGALMNGLALEQKLGTNPFKIGFIGGTDVHNSLTSIEEDNFFDKHVSQEPHPTRWSQVAKKGLGFTRYDWMYEAAGYAAAWATENTRTALWDAMMRKECYATSGTRMTVRFFGGWDYQPEDARTRYLAEIGYRKGVPMGTDLPKASAGANAPTFLVAAMKDPIGANLDRIQIIKGWLDKDGKTHEKIYDVVWGNAERRKRGANGKVPPVGDTVDVSRATWTNTIGDPELMAVWKDPDFNASQRAFYYVRVLEIPTPRWTDYDAVRFGVKMTPDVPMKHQERAWTSPIWYTPTP